MILYNIIDIYQFIYTANKINLKSLNCLPVSLTHWLRVVLFFYFIF